MTMTNEQKTEIKCACCGRKLSDDESIARGIGPDCWADNVADRVDLVEAETLVKALELAKRVAYKGAPKSVARVVIAEILALGFRALALRIAKRFHLPLMEPAEVIVKRFDDLEAARAEYRKLLTDFTYDNVEARELNALVKATGATTPAEFVKALENMTYTCRRCAGTGAFVTGTLNGVPTGPGGPCYRCEGKGRQTLADARRNRAFDEYNAGRAAAAMLHSA